MTRVTVWLGALSHFTPGAFPRALRRRCPRHPRRGRDGRGDARRRPHRPAGAGRRARERRRRRPRPASVRAGAAAGHAACRRTRRLACGSGRRLCSRCRNRSCARGVGGAAAPVVAEPLPLRRPLSRTAWSRTSIRSRRVRGFRRRIEARAHARYLLWCRDPVSVCPTPQPARIGESTDRTCRLLRSRAQARADAGARLSSCLPP